MLQPRLLSAAASHPVHGWVITGGVEFPRTSAEKTADGQIFDPFLPSLPLPLFKHCLVSLDGGNNGDFLLTGGNSLDTGLGFNSFNKKSYIFREGEWRQVEDMSEARDGKKPC